MSKVKRPICLGDYLIRRNLYVQATFCAYLPLMTEKKKRVIPKYQSIKNERQTPNKR